MKRSRQPKSANRRSVQRMVGLLTSGLEAAEGARITMEAWCAEERDPCNNDNYCRLLDWVKDVQRALGKQPNDKVSDPATPR